ncbi:MAG: hypothetical protein Aurels2KO_34340 [Aureliella sp.]
MLLRIPTLILGLVLALPHSSGWSQDELDRLRYQPKKGDTFSYEVSLEIDGIERKKTSKGEVRYDVTSAENEQLRFDFLSGRPAVISSSTTTSSSSQAAVKSTQTRFYYRPVSRFDQPVIHDVAIYSGKRARIAVSPLGELQSIDHEWQINYLLGGLPSLLFVPLEGQSSLPGPAADLPGEGQPRDADSGKAELSVGQQWEFDRKVVIRTWKESGKQWPTMIAFATPFPSGRATATPITTIADETYSFKIESINEHLVTISGTYELNSAANLNGTKVQVAGTRELVLDTQSGMPQSLTVSQVVSINNKKFTLRTPVKVQFDRIPDEEVKRRDAEAKARVEKQMRDRVSPFSSDQRAEIIAELESGDRGKIHRALTKLSMKLQHKPDPEIASVIVQERLLESDFFFNSLAQRVLLKWAPDGSAMKLNALYKDRGTVPSTGLRVDENTKLFRGQIIQYRTNIHSSFWHPGIVRKTLDDGKVLIAENGPFDRTKEVDRSNIQLAPPEVTQPGRPAEDATAAAPSDR